MNAIAERKEIEVTCSHFNENCQYNICPGCPDIHTCCSCRNTGAEMVRFNEYVGGKGLIEVWECQECLDQTRKASSQTVAALTRRMNELAVGA